MVPQAWQRHVEDGILRGNNADDLQLSDDHSAPPFDPPFHITIKPPLTGIGLPDRRRQFFRHLGLQPLQGKGIPFVGIAITEVLMFLEGQNHLQLIGIMGQ